MANANSFIQVEVVYAANASITRTIAVKISNAATVLDAIIASDIQSIFPEINLEKNPVGIFSQIVSLQDKLHDGDRIEIYRPLMINPKQQRKLKAKQQTHLKKP